MRFLQLPVLLKMRILQLHLRQSSLHQRQQDLVLRRRCRQRPEV
jgi:hypothetical protein